MTEVPAQTSPMPNVEVTTPGAPATPPVPATPAGNNAPTNPPSPTASTETRPGAGWGVNYEELKTPEDLTRAIELLDADGTPSNEQPGQVEAPAAAPTPTEPTPAAAPAAPPADDEGLTQPGQLPRNFKVPTAEDPLTFHTGRLFKEARLGGNKKITLGEAEKMAAQFLGIDLPGATPAAPAAEGSPDAAPAASPSTTAPASVQAKLDAAYADYQAARSNFDEVAEAKALREINELERQRTLEIQREQSQQEIDQTAAEAQFLQEWNRSNAEAVRLYPDAGNPQSALAQRAAQMQEEYRDSGDPALQAIYESANSALFFYQRAAADLGIAPTPAAAPAAAPVPSQQPPPRQQFTPQPVPRQAPPVQALLASAPGTTNPAAPTFDVNAIQNTHDLEAMVARLAA